MRTFWIIMLVLVVGGLVYAFRPSGAAKPVEEPARALPKIDVNAPAVPSAAPAPIAPTAGIQVATPQADPAPNTPKEATDVVMSVTPGPEVKSNAPAAAPATVSPPPTVAAAKVDGPKVAEGPKAAEPAVPEIKPHELTGEPAPTLNYEEFLKQMAAQDALKDAKAKEIAAKEAATPAKAGPKAEDRKSVV